MNTSPDNQEKHQEKTFAPLVQNWISLFGFWLAMAFLIGELIIIIADLLYGTHNPYIGILIYGVGPTILVVGLLLVPLGMWLEYRKEQKGRERKSLPIINLNNSHDRRYISVFIAATAIFLILTSVGTYQAYHLTESTEFCGLTCHQVMKPEYTAYHDSPHARVACVQCHIGPSAEWYVKSKISGLRQVYAVLTDSYDLPIDTPIENLVPARETCEQCHWPEKFFASVEKTKVYYAFDEENTPYELSLLLHIGGSSPENPERSNGIHWHIGLDHTLEFYASDDDRLEIPWVRVTHHDGTVDEYVDQTKEDFDPESIPEDEIITMDCINCHNRPSHQYDSPIMAVNQAMQAGLISPQLPSIKDNAVSVLREEYPSQEEAVQGIRESLTETYSDIAEDQQILVENAITQVQKIYNHNIFPEQKVIWSNYPQHTGHLQFPGCVRCHDGNHFNQNNEPIRSDCNLCHDIVRQGEGWEDIENLVYKEQDFVHPRGFGDLWEGQQCHSCHGPDGML